MLARKLSSLRIARCPGDDCLRPRVYGSVLRLRRSPVVSYVTISDPRNPQVPQNISLAHPKDPSNLNQPGPSQSAFPPPPSQTSAPEPPPSDGGSKPGENTETTSSSDENASLPVKFVHPTIDPQTNLPFPHASPASPPLHINPPFNTHRFFTVLEESFPTPIARNLMRATRALLVDRIGRVKRDALTIQDLESQAYLFRAALSELRSETSVLTRNETAAMRAATTALRREVDTLDTRMREDLATLKHEIQMDLDNRKSEARNDLKRLDIQVEEVLSRCLITISELKTQVEESRWEKLKAAVGALAVLSLVIIISVEIYVVAPSRAAKKRAEQAPPPPELPPPAPNSGTQVWTGAT